LVGPATLREASIPKGWCVIVEEQPLTAFPAAAEQANRLRGAGYPAGVYDTRAFSNLAWGELVIIAQGFAGTDARSQATRLAAQLSKSGAAVHAAGAYAKPCEPLSPPAVPVKSAAELPPLPSLPTTPFPVSRQLAEGCLAWSPRERAALCVLGAAGHDYEGNFWDLRFLRLGKDSPENIQILASRDDPPSEGDRPPLSEAQLQGLQRQLSPRDYVALSGLARTLGPGATFHSAVPRFSIRWERVRTARVGENSAPKYRDRIFVRCGGPTAQEQAVLEKEGPHESPTLTLAAIPAGSSGGPVVVLTTTFDAADEGEFGRIVEGRVVDLQTCNIVK
jgi:hypothetical protein